MIHSVTVHLGKEVHVQGLGLTSQMMLFAWGETPEHAEQAAMAYCTGMDLEPIRAERARVAVQQVVRRYTFPEQIVGLPDGMAQEAIRGSGYPEAITAETLNTLGHRQEALRRGLLKMANALGAKDGA